MAEHDGDRVKLLKGKEHTPDPRCPGCRRHDVKIGSRHKDRPGGAWCDGVPDARQPLRDAALDALGEVHEALTDAHADRADAGADPRHQVTLPRVSVDLPPHVGAEVYLKADVDSVLLTIPELVRLEQEVTRALGEFRAACPHKEVARETRNDLPALYNDYDHVRRGTNEARAEEGVLEAITWTTLWRCTICGTMNAEWRTYCRRCRVWRLVHRAPPTTYRVVCALCGSVRGGGML